ncbi:unnamed protein product [Sphagnum troendelagicum]|uniref:Uncharacterized protein n=1 Tax=Sphagnum troendelagicum TaxID=128251 RepID=A0ABP0V205_9BRYO
MTVMAEPDSATVDIKPEISSVQGPSSAAASPNPQHQALQQQQQQQQQQGVKAAVTGSNPGSSPGPNNEGRKISCEDIQLVQNLIERCLQLYMNQNEVITTLQYQAKIEPGFTSLVWQKLEEQNPEFFKAYYTRLKLKKQILLFNHLLEQQVQLMHKMSLFPAKPPLLQNVHHSSMGYPMAQPGGAVPQGHPHMGSMAMPPPSSPLVNGSPAVPDNYHPHEADGNNGMVDMALGLPSSGSSGGSDLSLGSMGSTPGGMTGGSFPFGSMGPTDISGMGMGLPTSIALDTPFATSDSHNQNGIGSLPMTSHDADVSSTRESLGSLGQLPRNFSLSDLTAELTNGADLGTLGSYSGSPFLTPDAFLRSPDKDVLDDDIDFADLK